MKKKILGFIGVCLFTFGIQAQVITTLQHNGATTVYYNQNGLIDAHAAAVNGDTIYLSGGHFNPVNIDKRISVFGAGHYPDSTAATGVTYIDGSFEMQDHADSAWVEGLYISGNLSFQNDVSVNYVRFRRNNITGYVNFPGTRTTPCLFVLFDGNTIGNYVSMPNCSQCDFSNNLLYSTIGSGLNCSYRNNIMFQSSYIGWPYHTYYSFYDCDNSLIENNILLGSAAYFQYCDNSLARNNLFVQSPWASGGTVNFVSNYVNIPASSIFVQMTNQYFTYGDNYHLQTPATYLGSDGTEVGIYGGAYPYKEHAVPVNPHLESVTIPANTDASGNLNINIKSTAQQK